LCVAREPDTSPCFSLYFLYGSTGLTWHFVQGPTYAQVIDAVIAASENDFEEAGVDSQTLQELRSVCGDIPLYCLLSDATSAESATVSSLLLFIPSVPMIAASLLSRNSAMSFVRSLYGCLVVRTAVGQ